MPPKSTRHTVNAAKAEGDAHLHGGRHAQALNAYFAIHTDDAASSPEVELACVLLTELAEVHLCIEGEAHAALAAAAAALVVCNFKNSQAALLYAKALHLCGGSSEATKAACPPELHEGLEKFTTGAPPASSCDASLLVGSYPHATTTQPAGEGKDNSDAISPGDDDPFTIMECGIALFADKQFGAAVTEFKRACCGLAPLGRLLSNSAIAFLALRQWRNAAAVAAAAPFFCPQLAEKNQWRYATAMAHLGTHLGSAIPGAWPEEVRTSLALIEKEGKHGDYDYAKMWAGTAVPKAEYTSDAVTVRDSPGKGRGVFALKDIPAGTLVLCSHPLTWVDLADLASSPAEIPPWLSKLTDGDGELLDDEDQIMVKQCLSMSNLPFGGSLLRRIYELDDSEEDHHTRVATAWGATASAEAQHPLLPCKPSAANFDKNRDSLRIVRAAHTNRFGSTHTPWPVLDFGLWPLPSIFNHSPVSNATDFTFGRFMMMRTTVDVAAGEELSGQYCGPSDYLEEDQPLESRGIISNESKDLPALWKLRGMENEMRDKTDISIAQFEQWKNASAPLLSLVDPVVADQVQVQILCSRLASPNIHGVIRQQDFQELVSFGHAVGAPLLCDRAFRGPAGGGGPYLAWDDPAVVQLRKLITQWYGDASPQTMKCLIESSSRYEEAVDRALDERDESAAGGMASLRTVHRPLTVNCNNESDQAYVDGGGPEEA